MKSIKYILSTFIVFSIIVSSCSKDDPEEQSAGPSFTVTADGENLINNGSRTYTGVGDQGEMDMRITNKTDAAIHLVMKVISISGIDGSQTELCIGNCYSSISAETIYPIGGSFELAANATTNQGAVHVLNQDASNGDSEILLKLYQVDSNNNELSSGTSIEFKYIYDAP